MEGGFDGWENCRYLAGDHERLDALLERAMSNPENIDAVVYAQFRSGLLKQIGTEEATRWALARAGFDLKV